MTICRDERHRLVIFEKIIGLVNSFEDYLLALEDKTSFVNKVSSVLPFRVLQSGTHMH